MGVCRTKAKKPPKEKAALEEALRTKAPPTRSIVLIGFMGTGKSAVGRVLARRTGFRHLDTDAEIERRAGKTIPQIFADDGEEAFRVQETEFLTSLAGRSEDGPLVRIESLLAGREQAYAVLADIVLNTSGCTNSEEGAARLMEQLKLT